MSRNINFISWFALALALLSWVGVGFFITMILSQESSHVTFIQQSQSQSDKTAQSSSLHALVSETADDRSALDALVGVDPTTIAQMITSAGNPAGIAMQISNASQSSVPSPDGKTMMQAFSFLATSQGSFASVMYATELLETLPVPSSIQNIQLMHAQDTPSGTGSVQKASAWQMSTQVRILTSATISP